MIPNYATNVMHPPRIDDVSVLWTPVWTAIVNDRIIENPTNPRLWLLPDGINWVGDVQELYNRECYDEITKKISSLTHALIYGTPGIGKSLYLQVFLVHLARRARAEKQPLPSIQCRYYDGDKVVNLSFLPDGSVININNIPEPPLPDYLLSDSVDISVPTGRILNLEVASDKVRNYNNFRKRVQEAKEMGDVFVMPLFRIHELQSIRPEDMDDQCTEFRHDVFGGSARNFNAVKTISFDILPVVDSSMTLIFSDVKKKQPGVWNAVARQISEKLSQRPTDSQTTVNSMMWHMIPGGSKIWASKFMEFLAGEILESRTTDVLDELKRIVGSSGIGFLFEAIGHRKLLMSTSSFLLKPLFKSLPNEQPEFPVLKFNGSVIRFKMIEEIGNLPDSAYGLPFTDQFPIADAIIQPDTLIQFTTSPKKHKGSLTNLTDVRAQLRAPFNEHRLIFVIPKENLDTFVYHTELKDIRQFICLPDPSVMVPKSLMNKTERKRWISKK